MRSDDTGKDGASRLTQTPSDVRLPAPQRGGPVSAGVATPQARRPAPSQPAQAAFAALRHLGAALAARLPRLLAAPSTAPEAPSAESPLSSAESPLSSKERGLGVRSGLGRVAAHLPRPLRQWQFWLVLAIGAFLRLYWLGHSPFYYDSALLYVEAARAARDHLLPGTGIYSSLLALNMPLYTLFLYPFANDPQAWTLLQALANVAGVALLYLWAESAFGRWAALVAGLFFATALYDTYNSGYVWQQCLILPLVIGALYTLHLGVTRRRHWFIPHALLLAAAIQVYPLSVAFLPLSLVGLALGWVAVTWYDFYIGMIGAVALFIPTLLFETASGAYDLPIYAAYLNAPRVLDGQALQQLSAALGPRPWDWLGAATPYARVALALNWFSPVIDALVALSLVWLALWLLWRVAAACVAWLRRHFPRSTSHELHASKEAHSADKSPISSEERGPGDAVQPRALVIALPLAAALIFLAVTLRHSSPIYVHYMFVMTPPLYVALGAFVAHAPGQAVSAGRWLFAKAARDADDSPRRVGKGLGVRSLRSRGVASRLRRVARAAPVGVMAVAAGVVIVTQTTLTGAFTWTFASGASPASTWGAIPTTSYEAALTTTQRAALRLGSQQVYLASDPGDPYMGLYWAQRQNNLATDAGPLWTTYPADACALTPPQGSPAAPTLVMGSGAAAQALAIAPGTRSLGALTLARGATYPLLAVAPNPASWEARGIAVVNGELRLDRAFILPASGGQPARAVTLWTALRSSGSGPTSAIYQFHFLFPAANGRQLTVWETCAPGSWAAGEGVIVVAPLPAGARVNAAPSVIVSRETHSWWRPQIGKLTLETAKELYSEPVVLPLSLTYGPGLAHPTQPQLNAATITPPLSRGWVDSRS